MHMKNTQTTVKTASCSSVSSTGFAPSDICIRSLGKGAHCRSNSSMFTPIHQMKEHEVVEWFWGAEVEVFLQVMSKKHKNLKLPPPVIWLSLLTKGSTVGIAGCSLRRKVACRVSCGTSFSDRNTGWLPQVIRFKPPPVPTTSFIINSIPSSRGLKSNMLPLWVQLCRLWEQGRCLELASCGTGTNSHLSCLSQVHFFIIKK